MAKDRAAGGLAELFLHLSALSSMTKYGLNGMISTSNGQRSGSKNVHDTTGLYAPAKKKKAKKKSMWRLMVGLKLFKI